MLTHAPWSVLPGLWHGFLDRRQSTGPAGWTVSGATGAPLPVAVPRQVHGARVVTSVPGNEPGPADALATATPGHLVGVVTADCVPIVLIDPRRRVAAAVHAGWRGAAAGVLEAAVHHLETTWRSRPADLEAVIGPAIGGCCYEIGPEVVTAFRARTGDLTAPAWEERTPRWHVDLRRAVQLLLHAVGIRDAAILGPCTVCDPGYHSYRRDGASAGRQLSFVGWA